jgi:GT2 family glycosyltransferase
VYTSSDADDWVRFIQGQGQPNEGDATAFAHRNSWYARCDFLLDTVEQTPEQAVNESISVIVLNRNNRLIISRCLESLLAHKRRYSYEILVVDNQSTDGSPELVAERFGDMVLLLRNEKNGCSSGRNLAMQYATGQVLVFLDSDQFALSDRWLDSALHVLRENRTVGAAGWAAGWFNPGSPAGPIAMYLPSQGATPDMLYRTDVAYLGTGGLVMRRETWEATSGFDEFYDPTCFEDTDLSLQMRDLGFELAYCPYINVGHLPHQTTQSGSETHLRLMERNGAYFTSKWRARNAKLLECYLAE